MFHLSNCVLVVCLVLYRMFYSDQFSNKSESASQPKLRAHVAKRSVRVPVTACKLAPSAYIETEDFHLIASDEILLAGLGKRPWWTQENASNRFH
jgi:hypothetical protein